MYIYVYIIGVLSCICVYMCICIDQWIDVEISRISINVDSGVSLYTVSNWTTNLKKTSNG